MNPPVQAAAPAAPPMPPVAPAPAPMAPAAPAGPDFSPLKTLLAEVLGEAMVSAFTKAMGGGMGGMAAPPAAPAAPPPAEMPGDGLEDLDDDGDIDADDEGLDDLGFEDDEVGYDDEGDEPEPDRECADCGDDPPMTKERNMAAPSGTNTAIPTGGQRQRYSRQGRPDRYAAEIKEVGSKLDRVLEILGDQEGRIQSLEGKDTYVDRYQRLSTLKDEGYILDPAEEIESTQDLTDEQFNRHVTKVIPARYQKAGPSFDAIPIRVADGTGRPDRNARAGGPLGNLTRRQAGAVARYAADRGLSSEEALPKLKAARPDLFEQQS